jgi:hypothetical protein
LRCRLMDNFLSLHQLDLLFGGRSIDRITFVN